MKKAIVLVVLLVLIGVGVGGMAALKIGPFKTMFGGEADKKEAPPPPSKEEDVVFPLGVFVIPVVKEGGISKQIAIEMEMEVDAAAATKVSEQMTPLQAAFLMGLYDVVPRHDNIHSPADKIAIRQRLIETGDKMLGGPVIHDIVIKAMYDR